MSLNADRRMKRLASIFCDLDYDEDHIDVTALPPAELEKPENKENPERCRLDTARPDQNSSRRVEADQTKIVTDLEEAGIHVKFLKHKPATMPTSGVLFGHAEDACRRFIDSIGGASLAVFKIGISADPVQRWQWYKIQNFTEMVVMCCSMELPLVESLEAHLVRLLRAHTGCRNQQPGGESMRTKSGNPRFPGPWFCYIVGSRADIRARIGS